ncbi:MAG TPA: hypothetical protein VMT74_13400 [Gaiellaceae bacterium]|nr:hypothetical protein [Gaiellaceae bacterium]
MRLFKSDEEKQAEDEFRRFADALATADPAHAAVLVDGFRAGGLPEMLSARDRKKLGGAAFERYAEASLADDHLTAEEEETLAKVADAVGLGQQDLEARGDLYVRLQVAKINAGRLPVVEAPHLMAKQNEVVHFETSAALMKEVAVREWRGGSQGVSFRIAKGVRYRVGATRGHIVTVGTQLQVADTGVLAITSQRIAYLGSRKTLDMPFSKLMGMELYSDGVRLSLSNRQSAPLFKVTCSTDVLGALLNAAAQEVQT